MPCRVGITTNPIERRIYWQSQVIRFKNWRIIKKFRTQEEAQVYENWYADKYNCRAHVGGPHSPGIWCVYRFDYLRER